MLSERFSILLVLPDQELAEVLSSALREHFDKVPLVIDFATDGVKALFSLAKTNYHLVISMVEMPIMDGLTLVYEIRKEHGSTAIFLLTKNQVEVEQSGVDLIQIPITDMEKFCDQVSDIVPEEMKAKFGLIRRESHQLRLLMKYLNSQPLSQGSIDYSGESFALIPNLFTSKESVLENSSTTQTRNATIRKQANNTNVQIFTEFFWLALLAAFSFYLMTGAINFDGTSYVITPIVVILTMFIFLGYFSSHLYNRYWYQRRKKDQN